MKVSNPKCITPTITLGPGEMAVLSKLEIRNKDILLGKRDLEIRMHPGTVAFRTFISTRVAQYRIANSRAQRIHAVALATKSIMDAGTRILQPARGLNNDAKGTLWWWVTIDERSCCEKVGMAIRDYIKAKIRDERTIGSKRQKQEPDTQKSINELPTFADILQRVIGGVDQRDGVVNRVTKKNAGVHAQKSPNAKPVFQPKKRTHISAARESIKSRSLPYEATAIDLSGRETSMDSEPSRSSCHRVSPNSTDGKLSGTQHFLASLQNKDSFFLPQAIETETGLENSRDKAFLDTVLMPHQACIDIFVVSKDIDNTLEADVPVSTSVSAEDVQLPEARSPQEKQEGRCTISYLPSYGAPTGGFSCTPSMTYLHHPTPTSSPLLAHDGRNASTAALQQHDLFIRQCERNNNMAVQEYDGFHKQCLQASRILFQEQAAFMRNRTRQEATIQENQIKDFHQTANPPVLFASNNPFANLDLIGGAPPREK